ncbi:MAG: 3-phosphoserine/phosphohydroxythreonine transaminase [Sandaracinaceae bacterium]
MTKRAMNFNPGPAALPLAALERAQRELLDFEGTGMSIMEHSHRGKAYEAVHNEAMSLLRELLAIPDTHDVLLLQGGARLQFAMVPMNLLHPGKSADYTITGTWAEGAHSEASLVGKARVAASTSSDAGYTRVPTQAEIDLDPNAAYLHVTSNNTLYGTQWPEYPDSGDVPLVADMTSDLLSRPIDVSKFGLIYAGAQKNVGPSGVTVVIVKKALIASARTDIPEVLRYKAHADKASLWNTPPTFAIYMLRNTLLALKEMGGAAALERINRDKAAKVYAVVDAHPELYRCPVEPRSRSFMNVVFHLPTEELTQAFLAASKDAGMVGLKGHRSVGGVRASLYNAVQGEWVDELVTLMRRFQSQHG